MLGQAALLRAKVARAPWLKVYSTAPSGAHASELPLWTGFPPKWKQPLQHEKKSCLPRELGGLKTQINTCNGQKVLHTSKAHQRVEVKGGQGHSVAALSERKIFLANQTWISSSSERLKPETPRKLQGAQTVEHLSFTTRRMMFASGMSLVKIGWSRPARPSTCAPQNWPFKLLATALPACRGKPTYCVILRPDFLNLLPTLGLIAFAKTVFNLLNQDKIINHQTRMPARKSLAGPTASFSRSDSKASTFSSLAADRPICSALTCSWAFQVSTKGTKRFTALHCW